MTNLKSVSLLVFKGLLVVLGVFVVVSVVNEFTTPDKEIVEEKTGTEKVIEEIEEVVEEEVVGNGASITNGCFGSEAPSFRMAFLPRPKAATLAPCRNALSTASTPMRTSDKPWHRCLAVLGWSGMMLWH